MLFFVGINNFIDCCVDGVGRVGFVVSVKYYVWFIFFVYLDINLFVVYWCGWNM